MDGGVCGRNVFYINNIELNKCVVIDGYIITCSIYLNAYGLTESSFEPKAPKKKLM